MAQILIVGKNVMIKFVILNIFLKFVFFMCFFFQEYTKLCNMISLINDTSKPLNALVGKNPDEPKPIRVNFEDARIIRQLDNNDMIEESLKKDDLETFKKNKNFNTKALKRMLKYAEITEEKFLTKCKEDPIYRKSIIPGISTKSSRQGIRDEDTQLNTCNETARKCGIRIHKLNTIECIPTKDGHIVSKETKKETDCLKSFDGKITGKVDGYITAKVVLGSGGHQDNVFEEMDTIAEWWKTHRSKTKEIFILLIETNSIKKIDRLKKKYCNVDNVMFFNHIEFQEYMIRTYHGDESM
jgi:hypothetical protein